MTAFVTPSVLYRVPLKMAQVRARQGKFGTKNGVYTEET